MDNLDFLDSPEGEKAETQPVETPVAEVAPEEAPAAEAQPEPTATTEKPAPHRGPDGKFAKKEEPVMVPLQALHETRDEVKALKQQLAALQPQQQQAPQVPDMFADPEGYNAHIQSQMVQMALDTKLNLSEEMVRQSAGDEIVTAAQEWAKQQLQANPVFAQAFYSNRNPYGFLVNEYKRQQTVAQLGNADPKEIEAFLAWKATQGGQPVAQTTTQQPTPPKSIASATSAGGVATIAMGPTVAFDNLFKN